MSLTLAVNKSVWGMKTVRVLAVTGKRRHHFCKRESEAELSESTINITANHRVSIKTILAYFIWEILTYIRFSKLYVAFFLL